MKEMGPLWVVPLFIGGATFIFTVFSIGPRWAKQVVGLICLVGAVFLFAGCAPLEPCRINEHTFDRKTTALDQKGNGTVTRETDKSVVRSPTCGYYQSNYHYWPPTYR